MAPLANITHAKKRRRVILIGCLVIALSLTVLVYRSGAVVCTPLGSVTTVLGLCKPQGGETNWATAINNNFDILDSLFTTGSILKVANGGTGLSTPGTSGNVLVSTGTAWQSGALPANSVGTAQLKTATGSVSGACNVTEFNITMNDYAFFPNLQVPTLYEVASCFDNNDSSTLRVVRGAAQTDTIGRFHLTMVAGANSISVQLARWRYITATDNPTIWIVFDALGNPVATWASDDPCTPDDATPCVTVSPCVRCTTKHYKASDFNSFSFPQVALEAARVWIQQRPGYSLANLTYRALQQYTGDMAPSRWINANMKLAGSALALKIGGAVVPSASLPVVGYGGFLMRAADTDRELQRR